MKSLRFRSCRGSVLMEFIVVAPIYLVMLGGLFIAADAAVNNIRFHIGEHFVTWMGGSRFCPKKVNAIGKIEKDAERVRDILKPLYDLSIGGEVADDDLDIDKSNFGFRVDLDNNENNINYFMGLYKGRVKKLSIAMPDWARGMLTSGESMQGKGTGGSEYEKVTMKRDYFRSFSLHRICDINETDRSRQMEAERMIYEDALESVLYESWANNPSGGNTSSEVKPSVELTEKGRVLGEFGE